MFVATIHQKVDVVDYLDNRPSFDERLGSYSRAVAIMDAVVPPLNDHAESLFHLVQCQRPCSVLIRWAA